MRTAKKQLLILVTADVHRELKTAALNRDCSMKQLIVSALRQSGFIEPLQARRR